MAHHAYFKQLTCLGLYTFGSINNLNRRICCHQGTVSILGEILMSRCIQNVDAKSVILKLQYR